jgi:hypothetical protein
MEFRKYLELTDNKTSRDRGVAGSVVNAWYAQFPPPK